MQHAPEPQTAHWAHNVHLRACAPQEVAVLTFITMVPTSQFSMLLILQLTSHQAPYKSVAKLLIMLIWILVSTKTNIVCQASMEHQLAAGTIRPTLQDLWSLQTPLHYQCITSAAIKSRLKKLRWLKLWSQLSWLLSLSFTFLEKYKFKLLYIQDF